MENFDETFRNLCLAVDLHTTALQKMGGQLRAMEAIGDAIAVMAASDQGVATILFGELERHHANVLASESEGYVAAFSEALRRLRLRAGLDG